MSTYVTADTNHIVVPWRQDLDSLIPHARRFYYQDQRMLLIPNGHDEAKLCRNVGVHVPAPILTRFDWYCADGKKPWDIQKTTSAMLTESPRAYVLSTMGTGKSRAALFAANYLRKQGVGPWLITAPLSTLSPVWESELFHMDPRIKVRVLHGSREKRLKLLEEAADYYVINHHGMHVILPELVARGFQGVVIDELAVFRTRNTQLWKAASTVVEAKSTKYAWGMTGAPTPNAPTDAWAQLRLLTPARTSRTMYHFQDQTMRKISNFKWVARPEANKIVHEAMQPSVRYVREDVMELPETIYADRDVKLEPDAARAYKMLMDKMRTLAADGTSITAVNEGILQNKLLQVACGFIYTDKKTVYQLPAQTRLNALDEIITEADRKVIVFVPYIHALEGITKFLHSRKHTASLIYGGTSRTVRDATFRAFQERPDPRIIVAHPQCMSHGLTLTAANTIVWYSPTHSLETYEQSNARITRPGQSSKTLIVHLSGTMVERLTYKRLRERARMQGILLQLFKDQQLEF